MRLAFAKMHGLGNDFVVFDRLDAPPWRPTSAQCAALAHRRRGVGCDQLVLLEPCSGVTARMVIINADGSEAEMCGNAARCVGWYLRHRRGLPGPRYTLATGAGVVGLELLDGDRVAVDMGTPVLQGTQIPTTWEGMVVNHPLAVAETTVHLTAVSMGNPHAVLFDAAVERFPLERVGPELERDPHFPRRVNVEVVQVLAPDRLRMRVWERGAGITEACGTGACAAAVAAVLNGYCQRRVVVALDGGELDIHWRQEDGRVIMTGAAAMVFQGEVDIED
ncbi:MAG: diaminopimelate epimerase [Magnetococcus sp. WYHC-3]